ncbi:aromatic aminotransferase ISS1-like [Impatiens glandulifera]|uniref:aromatic aminotransferase ISS1-like n=1 Tax=Impatiens glandulifera TaxID=253017 RepID=UPI001FB1963E|nr:aromatic aminotransferase ISS1-like [Impatiens glandulifera]
MTMGSYEKLSSRILQTDVPVMVKLAELSKTVKDAMPLGQGAVYWQPPEQALENVKQLAFESSTSRYGTHEGLPELIHALNNKIQEENKLSKSLVMVTAGSNQGFLNLVLALCDVNDSVVLFAPYFFNAYMTFNMTAINTILVGPSHSATLLPDIEWLEKTLATTKPVPKLVSIVNPGNPSGVCIPQTLLNRISEICEKAETWLVVDNAYEYFVYGGFQHSCVEGNHVINLFSFSKAYGMMGWRVGYIAYSSEAEGLRTQLLKTQDNVAICASIMSQKIALLCLKAGREWVSRRVEILCRNKNLVIDALSGLGKDAVKGGEGAIFLWVKLPENCSEDFEVVCWFAKRHGLLLLPGSACGVKGCVRITYGMLTEDDCVHAATRLKKGVEELLRDGIHAPCS